MGNPCKSMEEIAEEAMKHALKALRKRHFDPRRSSCSCFCSSFLGIVLIMIYRDYCQTDLTVYPILRDECSQLKVDLEDKIKALQVVVSKNTEIKAQLEQMTAKAKSAEAENKTLVDHLMLEKMKEAEHLNLFSLAANQLNDDMIERLKASGLERLARQQVDGKVHQSEEGADFFLESTTLPRANIVSMRLKQLQCSLIQHGWTDHIFWT